MKQEEIDEIVEVIHKFLVGKKNQKPQSPSSIPWIIDQRQFPKSDKQELYSTVQDLMEELMYVTVIDYQAVGMLNYDLTSKGRLIAEKEADIKKAVRSYFERIGELDDFSVTNNSLQINAPVSNSVIQQGQYNSIEDLDQSTVEQIEKVMKSLNAIHHQLIDNSEMSSLMKYQIEGLQMTLSEPKSPTKVVLGHLSGISQGIAGGAILNYAQGTNIVELTMQITELIKSLSLI